MLESALQSLTEIGESETARSAVRAAVTLQHGTQQVLLLLRSNTNMNQSRKPIFLPLGLFLTLNHAAVV